MKNLKSVQRAESILHLDNHLPSSRLNVGDALSNGIENWKKDAGLFIGFGILSLIITGVLSFIPIVGQIASSLMIAPALSLGGYLFAHKVHNDEKREFSDFFRGFDYMGEIVVSGLILFGCIIAILIPIGLAAFFLIDLNNTDIDSLQMNMWLIFGASLFGLVALYLSVLLMHIQHFIGFYNLSAWQAIQYSVKYGHKNWFQIFAFVFVTMLIIGLGIIGVIIGIFITLSFIYPMSYEGFRQFTKLDDFLSDGRNDDMISDHLSSL